MSQKTIPNLKPVEQIFAERVPPSTSMAATIWRHFRKHPGAIGGSIVFLLILILVLAAPLSPFNPEESNMAERLQPPSLRHLSATARIVVAEHATPVEQFAAVELHQLGGDRPGGG